MEIRTTGVSCQTRNVRQCEKFTLSCRCSVVSSSKLSQEGAANFGQPIALADKLRSAIRSKFRVNVSANFFRGWFGEVTAASCEGRKMGVPK